jgi:hypothetical protein
MLFQSPQPEATGKGLRLRSILDKVSLLRQVATCATDYRPA